MPSGVHQILKMGPYGDRRFAISRAWKQPNSNMHIISSALARRILARSLPFSVNTLLLAGFVVIQIALSLHAQSIQFSQVNRGIVEDRLQRTSVKNAKNNKERQSTLRGLFEEAGCKGEFLTEQPVKGSRVPNLICTLPGTETSTIVVGAHFDKVSEGEGIVDNWSGASLLPSLYQGLTSRSRRFTFVFIGFTDEEKGLVGSKYWIKQLPAEERTKIRAMVNIDSLGLSDTKIWVSRADKKLLAALSKLAAGMKLPVDGVNVEKVGDGDSHPFVESGIPAIDFHSITQETLSVLHTRRDNASAINLEDYYNTYRLLAAYLVLLDMTWNESVPTGTP